MEAFETAATAPSKNGSLPYSLLLELTVTDTEVITELVQRVDDRDRDEYALSALRIGVLALKRARGQVDGDVLKREGESLLKDVAYALKNHQTEIDQTLSRTLKEYFDPASGRFNERIERVLKKDGELEALLARKITSDDSELSRVLTAHLGDGSPIYRLLSPSEAEGVLAALRKAVNAELEAQRISVLKEFSLDNQNGSLSRLVKQLCDHNGALEKNVQGKIDVLLKQFSFDDEQSALSRMSRTVAETNRTISSHLTLDDKSSALSRLRSELLEVLDKHAKSADEFQQSVRDTLKDFQIRRQEAAKSTRHGLEFEAQVFEIVQIESQRLGDIASFVGSSVGRISACKTGDILVELGPEAVASGAKVVVEAKEVQGYSVASARVEIAKACDNRDAAAGLFVYSRKTAPPGIEPLTRYGQDVFVIWDAEDVASDVYLKLGLSVARALCTQKVMKRESENADFQQMDNAILEINKQIGELDKIRNWANSIKKNSDEILERVRISSEKLQKQSAILEDHLANLKQATGSS